MAHEFVLLVNGELKTKTNYDDKIATKIYEFGKKIVLKDIIYESELKKITNQIELNNTIDDIPEIFDNVIKFIPEIPDGPHTQEEHEEIEKWNERLQKLMEKEHASSNKNR